MRDPRFLPSGRRLDGSNKGVPHTFFRLTPGERSVRSSRRFFLSRQLRAAAFGALIGAGLAAGFTTAHAQEFLVCTSHRNNPSHPSPSTARWANDGRGILHAFAGDDLKAFFGFTPRIDIVERDTPNAFALHPNRIAISSALLELIDSTSEFAFIIAHELGHLREGGSRSVDTFAPIEPHSDNRISHELAADVYAMRLLDSSGFDPRAGITLLDKLGAASRRAGAAPEVVYPSLQRRIVAMAHTR